MTIDLVFKSHDNIKFQFKTLIMSGTNIYHINTSVVVDHKLLPFLHIKNHNIKFLYGVLFGCLIFYVFLRAFHDVPFAVWLNFTIYNQHAVFIINLKYTISIKTRYKTKILLHNTIRN